MKGLVIFFFLSAAFLAAAYANDDEDLDEADARWTSFKIDNEKEYDEEEEAKRKANFLQVDAAIKVHNKNPENSFKLGHNFLSDRTPDEKRALLGAVPPPASRLFDAVYDPEDIKEQLERAPTSLDLRKTTKCIGPVKNQASCGSCWAFSAISPLEFGYCKANGNKYISLSEQQIVDCDKENGGCNGGWPDAAWDYLQKVNGSQPTSTYAYTAKDDTCAFAVSKVKAKVTGHGGVAKTADAVVAALIKYGPLSVCVQVNDAFFSYKSGVFEDTTCTCTSTSCPINHAVTTVGYGTEKGKAFWIIRNSWSSGWGDKGYMKILKGVNMCGIENYVYWVTAKK